MAVPLPRKKLYRHLVKQLVADGFFDDWRTTGEICYEVNKGVPVRWSPMSHSRVFMYMRELALEERYIWENPQNSMVRSWKKS